MESPQQVAVMNAFDWSMIRKCLYVRPCFPSSVDLDTNILSGARLDIIDDDQEITRPGDVIKAAANTIVDELYTKHKMSIDGLRSDALNMQGQSHHIALIEPPTIAKIFETFFAAAMARIEELHIRAGPGRFW